MIATIRQYVKKNIIPTDNIYIITPLSDNDWIKQTKDRVPECIHKNIYHRNHLSKLANEIKNKTNVLLLLDEIHIACKNNQSVNKFINDIGLNNKDEFLKKNIKIVEFSATPDGTIYDIETQIYNNDVITNNNDYIKFSEIIIYEAPKTYKSSMDLFTHGRDIIRDDNNVYSGFVEKDDIDINGRVYQSKDLCCYNKTNKCIDKVSAYNNIKELINIIKRCKRKCYHIIRTQTRDKQNITINNFRETCKNERFNYITRKYDQEKGYVDVNEELLKYEPTEHTFIFIKDKLRCSKTLTKKYILELFTIVIVKILMIQSLYNHYWDGYQDMIIMANLFVLPISCHWKNMKSCGTKNSIGLLIGRQIQLSLKMEN